MAGYKYLVSADIEYLDGALKGLPLVNGYTVKATDEKGAQRYVRWLESQRDEPAAFVKAAGTGNKYRVTGNIQVTVL